MSRQTMQTRPAGAGDIETLLSMMRNFYQEDRIVYVEKRQRRGLSALLSDPWYGVILLFSGEDGVPAGYAIVTVGFTVEHGGRYALLDELYLSPVVRGQGWGGVALDQVTAWARQAGVEALRLEVHDHNPKAKAIYLKVGFVEDHRATLTRWLHSESAGG
ncbi:MAG: GNAT family N-acetyltransferase [Xanthomonadaceae bacterium]|jgi:GNAT superfamily N-acetyltransferase|nr:GNAT family N-acetyltransferase [Xanthomonadaceae bacterium]